MAVLHRSGLWVHSGMWGLADTIVIREVLEQKIYDLSKFRPPSVVVDIGAHIGTFAVQCRQRWPRCEIFCIEPMDHNLECLRRNVGAGVSVIKGAVSESDVVKVYWSPASAWPWEVSIHDSAFSWDATEEVPGVADLERFGKIDLLKFDCEGGESAIIRSGKLKNVRDIVGEWHRNVGGDLDAAVSDLTSNGWSVSVSEYTSNLAIVSGHNLAWR